MFSNNPAYRMLNTIFMPFVIFFCIILQYLCAIIIWIGKKTQLGNKYIYDTVYEYANTPFLLLLESINKLKIIHTGDDIKDSNKATIMFCNHPGYCDSLVLSYWLNTKGRLNTSTCFLMWKGLRYSPVGILQEQCGSKFLGYGFNEDEKTLKDIANKMNSGIYKTVVIFPEGGILRSYLRSKSNSYADKYNYNPLTYCMYPRVNGLVTLLKNIKDTSTEVANITLGYEGISIKNPSGSIRKLSDIGFSEVNNNVHIHNKQISLHILNKMFYPYEDDSFRNWLWSEFIEKNKLLQRFSTINTLFINNNVYKVNNNTNLYIRLLISIFGIIWTVYFYYT